MSKFSTLDRVGVDRAEREGSAHRSKVENYSAPGSGVAHRPVRNRRLVALDGVGATVERALSRGESMKVLRVVGLVLGILLLLAGGGLIAASVVAERGQSAVEQQIEQQGLKGPVDGTVVDSDQSTYTVEFTADDGSTYTATAVSTLATPPQVGDTVSVYYQASDPSIAVISDAPTTALGKVAGTLRVAGIVTLAIGGLLLVASIVGFILGRQTPSAVSAQPYGTGYPTPGGPVGSTPQWSNPTLSPYPAQPQPGYPTPPSPYPPQPPAGTRP
jgi:hypothetical protein